MNNKRQELVTSDPSLTSNVEYLDAAMPNNIGLHFYIIKWNETLYSVDNTGSKIIVATNKCVVFIKKATLVPSQKYVRFQKPHPELDQVIRYIRREQK